MYEIGNELYKAISNTINYKGREIQLYDYIELNNGDSLKIKIVSTNSNNQQGIYIGVVKPKGKKCIEVNKQKATLFGFNEKSFPKEGAILIALQDNIKISIINMWEETSSTGKSHTWHAWKNAAMEVKVEGDKRTYYCNDGDDDEDFDDIIFEITVIRGKE